MTTGAGAEHDHSVSSFAAPLADLGSADGKLALNSVRINDDAKVKPAKTDRMGVVDLDCFESPHRRINEWTYPVCVSIINRCIEGSGVKRMERIY